MMSSIYTNFSVKSLGRAIIELFTPYSSHTECQKWAETIAVVGASGSDHDPETGIDVIQNAIDAMIDAAIAIEAAGETIAAGVTAVAVIDAVARVQSGASHQRHPL